MVVSKPNRGPNLISKNNAFFIILKKLSETKMDNYSIINCSGTTGCFFCVIRGYQNSDFSNAHKAKFFCFKFVL